MLRLRYVQYSTDIFLCEFQVLHATVSVDPISSFLSLYCTVEVVPYCNTRSGTIIDTDVFLPSVPNNKQLRKILTLCQDQDEKAQTIVAVNKICLLIAQHYYPAS